MDQTKILEAADAFIDEHWEALVADVARLVAVPSVVDTAHASAESPSGEEAHEGLRTAIEIARDLGFDAFDDAGEVGMATLPGASETVLAMMCHADVVAPGDGWTSDPWTLQRKDGYLVGRGVLDDKGPLVVGLYAMKFFKDRGIELPCTLRMIVGTNEETGSMRDVAYYRENYGDPAFMFTPDNTFPVCYGEKGMYRCELWSPPFPNSPIVEFDTGDLPENAVAGAARMVVKTGKQNLPDTDRIKVTYNDDCTVTLEATGTAAHAAEPERGLNAIGLLIDYVIGHHMIMKMDRPYLLAIKKVLDATDGSLAGIAAEDEHFGALTCAAGRIRMRSRRIRMSVDVRYPTTTSPEELDGAFQALLAGCSGTLKRTFNADPFLMDPQSPIVQTMAQCYRDATGLDGEPFTVGGGTYAREFPRAVSFGVEDPHDDYPEWVGGMHMADEGVAEDTLRRALRTYILTISRLMEMDLDAMVEQDAGEASGDATAEVVETAEA